MTALSSINNMMSVSSGAEHLTAKYVPINTILNLKNDKGMMLVM